MGKYQGRVCADVILGRDATATAERLGSPRVVFTEPQLGAVGLTLDGGERARDRGSRGRRRDLGQRRRQLRRPQRPGNLADSRRHRPRGDRRRHLRRPRDRRVAARGDDRGHRRGADLDVSSTRCRRSRPAARSGSSCSRPMAPERSGRGAVAAGLLCGLLAVSALAYDGGPATRAAAAALRDVPPLRPGALARGLDPRLPHPPVDGPQLERPPDRPLAGEPAADLGLGPAALPPQSVPEPSRDPGLARDPADRQCAQPRRRSSTWS